MFLKALKPGAKTIETTIIHNGDIIVQSIFYECFIIQINICELCLFYLFSHKLILPTLRKFGLDGKKRQVSIVGIN